jgi:hypothetical protein
VPGRLIALSCCIQLAWRLSMGSISADAFNVPGCVRSDRAFSGLFLGEPGRRGSRSVSILNAQERCIVAPNEHLVSLCVQADRKPGSIAT